jgi:hypothetical protein
MTTASLLDNLALEDVMTVGKWKGKTVETIYKEDSGYLVWFREERRTKNGQNTMFNLEINTLLDMTIKESKSLRSKYKTWEALGLLTPQALAPTTPAMPPEPVLEPAVDYSGWGAF